MKNRYILLCILLIAPMAIIAQSKTTVALQNDYETQDFFFYNNTLRMLNQQEDPAFDALIKDIEKLKLLIVKKTKALDYSKVVSDYKKEHFEVAMSSRIKGKNFDVYLKGDKKTEGMLVLVNDKESLMVLDIVGSIALDKVTSLYNTLDESSDIGQKIKQFTGEDEDEKEDSDN